MHILKLPFKLLRQGIFRIFYTVTCKCSGFFMRMKSSEKEKPEDSFTSEDTKGSLKIKSNTIVLVGNYIFFIWLFLCKPILGRDISPPTRATREKGGVSRLGPRRDGVVCFGEMFHPKIGLH